MKIKKYVARSMPEAMNMIRKELGSDAVILNSKEKKSGGFLGLFKKTSIEVVAALDKESTLQKQQTETTEQITTVKETENHSRVIKEIKQLQQLLETQSFESTYNFPPLFEHAYTYLREQEVEESIARDLIQNVLDENMDKDIDPETLKIQLFQHIEQRLSKSSSPGLTFEKQIIQFVGPTGVGKTTTLAKVAALSMLEKKKKIAFITADTYRIAAIEQLKTYARILNVPVEVAYSMDDYKKAIDKFSNYDLIFVDTAGRNFRDPRYVKELTTMIDFNQYELETYLVLALTAKETDVTDTYDQFKQIPIEKVIFTKMDETGTYGSILNIGIGKSKAIAYITNGQDVPDDILEADPSFISELVLSRYHHA